MSKNILLMTGAINVNKNIPFHYNINTNTRLQQYINALVFYIIKSNIDFIVFCDGTNFDLKNKIGFLKKLAKLYNKDIEFLSFSQNTKFVIKKGKGYGENEIIEYAISNSQIIKNNPIFYKVTGRYIIRNINKILLNEKKEVIFFKSSPLDNTNCNTAFFKCSTTFFYNNLSGAGDNVNDRNGYFLEHEYMKRLHGKKIDCFKDLPILSGIAGGGRKLDAPQYITIVKQILNLFGLYKLGGK